MSDADRKVFSVESVLALVTGKEGANTKDIAGYVTGRSIACDCCAKASSPFAAAWLARLYPKFVELEWKDDMTWETYVSKGRSLLGDNVSLTPMDGRAKAATDQALDYLADSFKSLQTQTAVVAELEARVRVLEPMEAKAAALQKKCDELEAKIKSMNADMGALRKQAAEFQGKVAINHDELMQNIKSAIKDGLKGIVVGGEAGAAAGAVVGTAESAPVEENVVPNDFGFGSSGSNSDGFGF
ncbi:MAG: hypothetical protein LBR31_03970 [Desulfovibrio sp.]|nr:hypothetical protein [Desulfovibrio sp.]